MTMEKHQAASCMILKTNEQQWLVPRNIVAEVIKYSFINTSEDKDSGMSFIEWRGCRLPHITLFKPGQCVKPEASEENRVVIVYGLQNPGILPYYSFQISKSPQLLQVGDNDLTQIKTQSLHPGELMQVEVDGIKAIIPQVDYFENSILKRIH